MKPVLILQHQTPEHAAYLITWLNNNQIPHVVYNAGSGQNFPASIEPYSALAVLGGGMSSNDQLLSNRQAEILILQAMRLDIPVIGHCLGGQLMTRALGGTIGTSLQPEIGWQPIEYTNNPLVAHWCGITKHFRCLLVQHYWHRLVHALTKLGHLVRILQCSFTSKWMQPRPKSGPTTKILNGQQQERSTTRYKTALILLTVYHNTCLSISKLPTISTERG